MNCDLRLKNTTANLNRSLITDVTHVPNKKRSPRKTQKARKKPGTGTISKAHRQDWKDECRKPGNIRRSIFFVSFVLPGCSA